MIDISVRLSKDTPVWPGSARVAIERVKSFAAGDDHVASTLKMDVHSGTHVDAPLHFVDGGAAVEDLALNVLVGDATLVDFGEADVITPELLESRVPRATERLLCKTRNSKRWSQPAFDPDFVALSSDGAKWLVDAGIRLVGVDYLSVQRFSDNENATHERLLGAGVVVVEGLDLSGANEGDYELFCLPLKLVDAEGAPARAILRERQ